MLLSPLPLHTQPLSKFEPKCSLGLCFSNPWHQKYLEACWITPDLRFTFLKSIQYSDRTELPLYFEGH